ncbi:replication-relaxation family protein [Kitasatospora sp. NPDC004669]|uniref:replication-relaxation family protein n=1 Tax=Kitasatospora sp. NPDC004669 TaxID=3154555 RepID=UPI0033A09EC5
MAAGGCGRAGRRRFGARDGPLGDGRHRPRRRPLRRAARGAANETVLAFVLGGTAPGAADRVGTVRSWSTETGFALPGGNRKVRPDGVRQAPEVGAPVLMVEVDCATMAQGRVVAKFTAYRELFRVKVPATASASPLAAPPWSGPLARDGRFAQLVRCPMSAGWSAGIHRRVVRSGPGRW